MCHGFLRVSAFACLCTQLLSVCNGLRTLDVGAARVPGQRQASISPPPTLPHGQPRPPSSQPRPPGSSPPPRPSVTAGLPFSGPDGDDDDDDDDEEAMEEWEDFQSEKTHSRQHGYDSDHSDLLVRQSSFPSEQEAAPTAAAEDSGWWWWSRRRCAKPQEDASDEEAENRRHVERLAGLGCGGWLTDTLAQMACLSAGVGLAHPASVVPKGWELIMYRTLSHERDHMALYRSCTGRCAIAFTGTKNIWDVATDLKIWRMDLPECGIESVHSGFARKTRLILAHLRKDQEFVDYLRSDNCEAGVASVGFSLGGALATLLAACANDAEKEHGNASHLFKVDFLYTFGTPKISSVQITNPLSRNGCFHGVRFWTKSTSTWDPVPSLPNSLYMHPRVASVRLTKKIHFNGLRYEFTQSRPCDSKDAASSPYWVVPIYYNKRLHKGWKYARNLIDITRSKADVIDWCPAPTTTAASSSSDHWSEAARGSEQSGSSKFARLGFGRLAGLQERLVVLCCAFATLLVW
eukprot:TRINITY_DN65460_c0_g1_i1.p2 TRINITY_DN65460_c0_g1~~TRINITY_DN65460_c0_g1_i1.p2  ORF type:complete len:520 (-),score=115.96 TRINITY_DN65460_c0_g1_i1:85-1644(-)